MSRTIIHHRSRSAEHQGIIAYLVVLAITAIGAIIWLGDELRTAKVIGPIVIMLIVNGLIAVSYQSFGGSTAFIVGQLKAMAVAALVIGAVLAIVFWFGPAVVDFLEMAGRPQLGY